MAGEPVEVARFGQLWEADMARAHLEGSGIDAWIMKDDAGGMYPSMQMFTGVRLFVAAEDADAARELLTAADFPHDDEEEEGDGDS